MQFPRKDLERNLIDLVIDGMENAMKEQYAEQIDNFLLAYNVDTWIIASDYAMGRPEFTDDAMVFVLIPYIKELFPPTQIDKHLPVDFKRCGKTVDPSYISYLRSAPTFSFVFLINRSHMIFADAELAAQAVLRSIKMMKSWPNAHEEQNAELIRKAELCLSEAKTESFLRKVNQVTILCLLGAFAGLAATKKKKLEGLIWAPDRDNMTGVWQGLSSALFQANMHSILHRREMVEKYKHGIAYDKVDVKKMWFDSYVRLADFLATPAAAMTRAADAEGSFEKCNQIVKGVFADNPRVIIQRFAFLTDNDQIRTDFRRVHLSNSPSSIT